MRRSAFLLGLVLVGCGGPDRETFVREANAACRERAAGQEALGALPPEELFPAATRLYEQELDRLRTLEPPEEDQAEYAAWVRASGRVVTAYRRYAANIESRAARKRVTARFASAAELAGDLGLRECDG